MRIALFHGYELTGSGSNEYTRYLARALSREGHEVHIICRDPEPEGLEFISKVFVWDRGGSVRKSKVLSERSTACVLHQIPHAKVRPVYLTDKQRSGTVKSFCELSDVELRDYHNLNVRVLVSILRGFQFDILHANHLVYQPVVAAEACRKTNTPFVIFPHGSAIEYTVREDERYLALAEDAVRNCNGIISGNREVLNRILELYPDQQAEIREKSEIVGVGVDTNLFKPVPFSERRNSIAQLESTTSQTGKTPEQVSELFHNLKSDGIAATQDYWNAYDHDLPDADFKEQLGRIPWDGKILLFVGALTAGKGLHSLIVAMAEILERHRNTHLVIVGAGAYREVLEALVFAISTRDQLLLEQLCVAGAALDRSSLEDPWDDAIEYLSTPARRLAVHKNGHRLLDHVHFVGRLDHSKLCHLFPCADLAVFPSIVPEAYPLVLMEALSNGVLPVVSYFSGFKDGIDELEPFLGRALCDLIKIPMKPQSRISKLAANISELLDDPDLRQRSSMLRAIATKHYDWHLRAKQMERAYARLAKSGDSELGLVGSRSR